MKTAVKTIVFLLEELSAKEMLEGLLPKLIRREEWFPRYIVFDGKQDLEKQLERKIRGWQTPNTRFVVLRDKDRGDCLQVKQKLKAICEQAGKKDTVIRIACAELESWYLGDLQAVSKAYNIQSLSSKQNQRKFRDPDKLSNPVHELKQVTENRYQKISGSRIISKNLRIEQNQPKSFNVFIEGICKITTNSTL